MTLLLNPKIGLTIILFSLMRFADIAPSLKGALFIICSLTLIYLSQKDYSKKLFISILSILILFIFICSLNEFSFKSKNWINSNSFFFNEVC